jgi:hypothetical protein
MFRLFAPAFLGAFLALASLSNATAAALSQAMSSSQIKRASFTTTPPLEPTSGSSWAD